MVADTKYETIRGEVVSGSFSSSGPDPFGGFIGDADAMRRFAE